MFNESIIIVYLCIGLIFATISISGIDWPTQSQIVVQGTVVLLFWLPILLLSILVFAAFLVGSCVTFLIDMVVE